ncbi:SAF domain-containing protein [Paenibacillus sp. J5C_2022]|uniref:SAF domain-containing protein n=1 Tax=Paenibacillus sp. J5C2022 TaxID=2977129 RepID=UPI0021D07BD5|nr:SAF domain-containing protein [Paenibacillus sp. J5C2022]MCU6711488.1 SAF domain-containing protein [Paenibacillus sp. J5C2022]
MSWSYRHRKALVIGTIAISVCLLIAASVYLMIQHTDQQQQHQRMQAAYEQQIEQFKMQEKQDQRNVWTTVKTVQAGNMLTAADLKAVPMPVTIVPPGVITDREAIIGKSAKVELSPGTPLLSSLLYEGQPIPKDLRIKEFQVIQLPSNLKPTQFIDVRIGFPTGEDFVLLSKKRVRELSGMVVWLEMNELDILQTSSAIVDAYLQGARLYALPYLEPGLQEAAIVNYPANPLVLDLMENDPNLLEVAETELARKLRETLDNNLKAMSESDKLRATSGSVTVQQQLQNERTTTQQGNAIYEMQSPTELPPTLPAIDEQQPISTPAPTEIPSDVVEDDPIASPSTDTQPSVVPDDENQSDEEKWNDIFNQ